MNEEFYLGVSGRVHHLFLSMEELCASEEKTLQCQTRASMGSMTGCNSVQVQTILMVMTHLMSCKTLLLSIHAVSKVTRPYCSMSSLSLHVSHFFFSLQLSDAITHVPTVFLLGMLANVPLDTFVYLTIHEGNQTKYRVIGGNPEKLEGGSAIQQDLSKGGESTGRPR